MSEVFAGGWTLAKLKAKSPEDRYRVWENARRRGDADAMALARLIETSGLEYAEQGGISMTDPRVIEMDEVITSEAGRRACVDATAAGLPALAGVEPLIVERMGDRYASHSQITVTAGSLVGQVMYALGYEKAGQAKMPDGSVAKTAATWRPKGQ